MSIGYSALSPTLTRASATGSSQPGGGEPPRWLARRHAVLAASSRIPGGGERIAVAHNGDGWRVLRATPQGSTWLTDPCGWDEAAAAFRSRAAALGACGEPPPLAPGAVLRRHGVCVRCARVTLPSGAEGWLGVTTAIWAKLWLDTARVSRTLTQGSNGSCLRCFDSAAASFAVPCVRGAAAPHRPPSRDGAGWVILVIAPRAQLPRAAAALRLPMPRELLVAIWALRRVLRCPRSLQRLAAVLPWPTAAWLRHDAAAAADDAPQQAVDALLSACHSLLLWDVDPAAAAALRRRVATAPHAPGVVLAVGPGASDGCRDPAGSPPPSPPGGEAGWNEGATLAEEASALALPHADASPGEGAAEGWQCSSCGVVDRYSGSIAPQCTNCHHRSVQWFGPYPLRGDRTPWKRTAHHCGGCGSAFGLFGAARHHCRQCGGIFCSACSAADRMQVRGYGSVPQRVCHRCYEEHLSCGCARVEITHGDTSAGRATALLLHRLLAATFGEAVGLSARRSSADETGLAEAALLPRTATGTPQVFKGFEAPGREAELLSAVMDSVRQSSVQARGRRRRVAAQAVSVLVDHSPDPACRAQAHLLRAALLREFSACDGSPCTVTLRQGFELRCPKCHGTQHWPIDSESGLLPCFSCGESFCVPASAVDAPLAARLHELPDQDAGDLGEGGGGEGGEWQLTEGRNFAVSIGGPGGGLKPLVGSGDLDTPTRLALVLRGVRQAAATAVTTCPAAAWRVGDWALAPRAAGAGKWWRAGMSPAAGLLGCVSEVDAADGTARLRFGCRAMGAGADPAAGAAAELWYPVGGLMWAGPPSVAWLRHAALAAGGGGAGAEAAACCVAGEAAGRRYIAHSRDQAVGAALLRLAQPPDAHRGAEATPVTPLDDPTDDSALSAVDSGNGATVDMLWQCPNCGMAQPGAWTGGVVMGCQSCGSASPSWRGPVPAGAAAAAQRPVWVRSDAAQKCEHCKASFRGLLAKARHHCRQCGKLFCDDCTQPERMLVPGYGESLQRACLGCYAQYLKGSPECPAPARVEIQHDPADRDHCAVALLLRSLLLAHFPSGVAVQRRTRADCACVALLLPRAPSDEGQRVFQFDEAPGGAARQVEQMLRHVSRAVPLILRRDPQQQQQQQQQRATALATVDVVIRHAPGPAVAAAAGLLRRRLQVDAAVAGCGGVRVSVEEGLLYRCSACGAEWHTPAVGRCGGAQLRDFGHGLAACVTCAGSCWNRGCGRCGHRLCTKCFVAHRSGAALRAGSGLGSAAAAAGAALSAAPTLCRSCKGTDCVGEVTGPHFAVAARDVASGTAVPLVSQGPLDTPTRLALVLRGVRRAASGSALSRPGSSWRPGEWALAPGQAAAGEWWRSGMSAAAGRLGRVVATDPAGGLVQLDFGAPLRGAALWYPAAGLRWAAPSHSAQLSAAAAREEAARLRDLAEETAAAARHASASAGGPEIVTVTVYADQQTRYRAHCFVKVGDDKRSPPPDSGMDIYHKFGAYASPQAGCARWEVLKAATGQGNWLRPEGADGPPGGGPTTLLATFWARRLDPATPATHPADTVYVRYRHAKLGKFMALSSPDPSTCVGPESYTDGAWALLYALEPARPRPARPAHGPPEPPYAAALRRLLAAQRGAVTAALRANALLADEQAARLELGAGEGEGRGELQKCAQQLRGLLRLAAGVVGAAPLCALRAHDFAAAAAPAPAPASAPAPAAGQPASPAGRWGSRSPPPAAPARVP